MKTVSVKLPYTDGAPTNVYLFGDEHVGSPYHQDDNLINRIFQCKNDPHGVAVLCGDIFENVTKSSVGNVYEQDLSPMKQLERCVSAFRLIKDKIVAVVSGNHEARSMRGDGIDLTKVFCRELQIEDKYDPDGVVLFLRVGNQPQRNRPVCYTFYITHGAGGGRTAGAKVNALERRSNVIDVDVYIGGHTHAPFAFRENFFRIDTSNNSVAPCDHLFVNLSACLNYGGYAERAGYAPASLTMPRVELCSTYKRTNAVL